MNDSRKFVLLTPSARSAFDEIRSEYENSLLEKASEIANDYRTGEAEISLRDVIEAKERLNDLGGELRKLKRGSHMASVALLGGFSYALMGVYTFFVVNGVKNIRTLFSYEYIWMLFIIIGMILMIFPLFYNFHRMLSHKKSHGKDNGFSKYISTDTIVKMWSLIEQKSMELMTLRGINIDNNSSFTTAYDFLIHELNSREYIDIVNNILKTRNGIVHTKDYEMKKEDVAYILNLSQNIINELDKRIHELSDRQCE